MIGVCGFLFYFIAFLPISQPSIIRFSEPTRNQVFTSSQVPLSIELDPNYELGPYMILCVDVTWALGEQSFCKDKLEKWVFSGLDQGMYTTEKMGFCQPTCFIIRRNTHCKYRDPLTSFR